MSMPPRAALGSAKGWSKNASPRPRAFGYKRMTLWTNDILTAARHIYRAQGSAGQRGASPFFGKDLVGQTWELDLEEKECPAEHRRSA